MCNMWTLTPGEKMKKLVTWRFWIITYLIGIAFTYRLEIVFKKIMVSY